MPEEPAAVTALEARLRSEYSQPGLLSTEQVVVKAGPRAYKSAALLNFGDKASGVVRKRELRVQTWRVRSNGPGFDFERAEHTWHCEDEEIDRLAVLLSGTLDSSGEYSLVKGGSSLSDLASLLQAGVVNRQGLAELASVIATTPELIDLLARTNLLSVLEQQRHEKGLARLRDVVESPASTENDLQAVLQEEWWVFGSRYVAPAARRSLVVLDQFDIPLIRADGALHVVELKRANVPALIEEHRNHLVVGTDIHRAVSQTMNYLRSLDEERPAILANFGIDCRRAFATVVVGHPKFQQHSVEDVHATIRTYNSHLTRIDVITYQELLDGAQRALAWGTSETDVDIAEEEPF